MNILLKAGEPDNRYWYPGLWIRIDLMRIRIRIQGFDVQQLEKFTGGNFFSTFFYQKLQFTYPWASLKDAQATAEAFNFKREHPALQNMKIRYFFLFLCVFLPSWIRIRIQ
jgi:hypothetical protein